MALPGIGEVFAQRILTYREKNGPFASLDELGNVPGIGPARLEELKDYLIRTTAAGIRREDVMNHFWEIDNKPVEDKLYWEEVKIDMRKHK